MHIVNTFRKIFHFLGARSITVLAILSLIPGCFTDAAAAPKKGTSRKFTVTLDAGHGGHDTGALGVSSNEKTITLSVVKKLGELIEKNLKDDVKVVYTRDGDYFVTLQGRAQIANEAGSDLFISVHINSVAKSSKNRTTVEGCQVYTLGLHKTAENLNVAKRENSVMELEDDHTTRYSDFDPDSQESDIAFELFQNKRMEQSIEFADAVHNELVTTAGRQPRGVRQAGFWVLWATSMPSVLVELDFICNPEVEKYLKSDKGQQEMATAIYNAFCGYVNTYGNDITGHDVAARRLRTTGRDASGGKAVPPPAPRKTVESAPVPPLPAKDRLKEIPDGEGTFSEPYYRVQIAASSRPYSRRSPELKGYKDVEYYLDNGLYKYTIGPYSTPKKARKALEKARKDFPDSFVVIIVDGKRAGMLNTHDK